MTPVKINYSVLRSGDIYLTHSNKPVGRIIRMAETLKWNPCDDKTPTHGGIIIAWDGQLFAAEMDPRLKINSLEKYTGRYEQIVDVYRPRMFDDRSLWNRIQAGIALQIRRNMEGTRYDLWGAILSSPLGRSIFGNSPLFKNHTTRQFCTEFVCNILHEAGDNLIGEALSPLALLQALMGRGEESYQRIYNYQQEKAP
jgi:hypothetical protein